MADKKFVGIAADFINAMKTNFIGKGADPNSIIVKDLYRYDPGTPNVNNLSKDLLAKRKEKLQTQLSKENREILETLFSVYNDKISTKRELLTQSRRLYETDVVQTMIDVMIDDGFNSFADVKEEFKIEYDLDEDEKELLGEDFQNQVQNIFDEFVEKFNLKAKIADIVPELLRDGEYAFGILYDEENKKGITDIVDDMDVINLLPFYEGDKLSFVIKQEMHEDNIGSGHGFKVMNNMSLNVPKIYKPDNIVFFRLKGPTKKRINMSLFYDQDFRAAFLEKTGVKLPKYIRIPLPIYYSAIKNLNRLQLMENVSTVLDLSEVLKPEIVTVSVPSNTSGPEAQQIIRDYERQLNDNTGLSNTEELDISTLAAQANRRKVLPQWLDNKGSIGSTGIGSSTSPKSEGAWSTVSKLRDLIALSVGIPPFYINLAETPREKHETIKLYSRYTRKLTSLQKTLADGIKEILMLHCKSKGVNISKENINVHFKAITSGDALEDTDMMVATVTGINDLYKGIDEIASSDNNNFVIDDQQFKQLFDNLTSKYLNISDIIKIDENKFNEQEFQDEEGFEPIGSPSGASSSRMSVGSDNIDQGFEELTGGQEDTSYEAFANAEPEVELEGTQEIETEA